MNKQNLRQSTVKSHIKTSKMGYEFDINENRWQLDNSTSINLDRFKNLDFEFKAGLRVALSRYAEELSAAFTKGVMEKLLIFFKYTKMNKVTVHGLRRWRESLNDESEWKLGYLKAFLISWYDWGIPGVDRESVDYLETLTLKGMVKGRAVKNRCPHTGPYTDQEQTALAIWATNAFEKNKITLCQYTLFLTLFFTGRRLVQLRFLRSKDLQVEINNGVEQYYIQIPRAKQRGVGFRESFKRIEIVKDLYLLVNAQIKSSQMLVKQRFKNNITSSILEEVPIFLERSSLEETKDLSEYEIKQSKTPDYYHLNSRHALDAISHISRVCEARSERTGDYIHITSRRFRYTKGTNYSKKGIGGVYLAEALDHSDTQHIGVYIENTPNTAEIIDEVMAPALAPLAQAFAGQLIDSERDAIRANDPHSRIRNDRASKIGNCGTHSFCANGYRSCYTCVNFQPWRDAPHHEVRDEILSERKRQKEAGVSVHVIQATDRLLLAVEQVIQMCGEVKRISYE